MNYVPRWYQSDCEAALYRYFETHPPILTDDGKPKPRNPICCMPTGTGKSFTIASFIANTLRAYPLTRAIMLTHVKELIVQNAKALLTVWPQAPLGIYSAGLGKKEINNQIIYAGIGSIRSKAAQLGHIDIIVIDECHLLSPNSDTMYQKFINDLKLINPWIVVIGFTATAYRLGIGSLTNNGIFTDTAYDLTTLESFNRLVYEGYMAPLTHVGPDVEIDIGNVGMSNGDYKQSELQAQVDKPDLTDAIVRDILRIAYTRRSALFFAAGVEHANHVSETFMRYGVNVPAIHSEMDSTRRDQLINSFKNGEFWGLVNNNILTTGFDHPPIDLIGMLRPTVSAGLWVQMLGRGTRPSPDTWKRDCLVLDYAGNTRKLGPINDPNIPGKKGKGAGQAPVWKCPACKLYNHAKAPQCVYCGHEHDMQGDVSHVPAALEVMRGELPIIEMFRVNRVLYYKHVKEGRPDMMRVVYQCGLRSFTEWVFLEHGGVSAKNARDWWRKRFMGEGDPPETTDDALSKVSYLKTPERITVWTNRQYPEVMGVEF